MITFFRIKNLFRKHCLYLLLLKLSFTLFISSFIPILLPSIYSLECTSLFNLIDFNDKIFSTNPSLFSVNSDLPSSFYSFNDPMTTESQFDLIQYLKLSSDLDAKHLEVTSSVNSSYHRGLLSFQASNLIDNVMFTMKLSELTPFSKLLYENSLKGSLDQTSYYSLYPHTRIFMVHFNYRYQYSLEKKDQTIFLVTTTVKVGGKKTLLIHHIDTSYVKPSSFLVGTSDIINILNLIYMYKNKFDVVSVAFPPHDLVQHNRPTQMVSEVEVMDKVSESDTKPYTVMDQTLYDIIAVYNKSSRNNSASSFYGLSGNLRLMKVPSGYLSSRLLKIFGASTLQSIDDLFIRLRPHPLASIFTSKVSSLSRSMKYILLLKYLQSYANIDLSKEIEKPTGWLFTLLSSAFLDEQSSSTDFRKMLEVMFNKECLPLAQYIESIKQRFDVDISLDQAYFDTASYLSSKHFKSTLDLIPIEALIRSRQALNTNFCEYVLSEFNQTKLKMFVFTDTFDIFIHNGVNSLSPLRADIRYNLISGERDTSKYFLVDALKQITELTRLNSRLFLFQQNSKWGLIDAKSGITVLQAQYDSIEPVGNFIKFSSHGKWGLLNNDGALLIPPRYDEISLLTPDSVKIKEGDLYGVYEKGGIMIHPQYKRLQMAK